MENLVSLVTLGTPSLARRAKRQETFAGLAWLLLEGRGKVRSVAKRKYSGKRAKPIYPGLVEQAMYGGFLE